MGGAARVRVVLGRLFACAALGAALAAAGAGCHRGACGDGAVGSDEQCDDGDATGGDGCSALCAVEPGYACAGEPSVCTATGPVCGDGLIDPPEDCDDDGTADGDGCSAVCAVEAGFACSGVPSVCVPAPDSCGNGAFDAGEGCDDGNIAAGDGCDDTCDVEPGYTCTGEPSVCTNLPSCGDGVLDPGEACDDAGESATCDLDCSAADCGDGVVNTTAGEACDDGGQSVTCDADCSAPTCGDGTTNTAAGEACDGAGATATCDADCTAPVCGDAVLNGAAGEACDDGGAEPGDGCDASCVVEFCGDGVVNNVTEQCDDGGTSGGDGCGATCAEEAGYYCAGDPSVCSPRTGGCNGPLLLTLTDVMGTLTGTAMGDNTGAGNDVPAHPCGTWAPTGDGPDVIYQFTLPDARDVTITLDGSFDVQLSLFATPCDAASEIPEPGQPDGCSNAGFTGIETLQYVALPAGSYFVVVDGSWSGATGTFTVDVSADPTACGNGAVNPPEPCDDGNAVDGDGCSHGCVVEDNYACVSSPSMCFYVCGNGLVDGAGEECDDAGTAPGDGCDAVCRVEPGFTCSGEPSVCGPACGDGAVDPLAGEECDDANTVAGDRCSACLLDYTFAEVEPNGTTATAEPVVDGDMVRGALLPVADVDLYTFTVTTVPATITVELYSSIDGIVMTGFGAGQYDGNGTLSPLVDCPDFTADDPDVRLFGPGGDPTNNATALVADDLDGDGFCSYIGPSNDPATTLNTPGTYYLKVTHFNPFSGTMPRYIMDVQITP
ncbi:MAG TPA: DUF4215 domain-containing protein [Myxococcota bacterium]|jgi:cysteine-rich repeat protein|nr:DUF4215 domain-containing protein [Myxococcota bacterium]